MKMQYLLLIILFISSVSAQAQAFRDNTDGSTDGTRSPIPALPIETFEGVTFPPAGWQSSSLGQGWYRSDDGVSAHLPIPAGDGFYAVTNDELAGSANDGSADYLITPVVDLRESPDYALYFDHYFTMTYGEAAFIEYSLDGGATWDILQSVSAVGAWTQEMVDLSAFSGPGGSSAIWFAFHYDDMGEWASGWAVDNVAVSVGAPPPPPQVPISNWAIYLGIFLMGGFMIVRYRRRLFA
jgi:hypothetical protein